MNAEVPMDFLKGAESSKNKPALTKAGLIAAVQETLGVPRAEAARIVELILDSIVRALRAGDKVEVRGFGSFRLRQRAPRTGRNPKTGARVDVPAKKIPYFKPSKELKEQVTRVSPS